MTSKSIMGQLADEILGAPTPAAATPADLLQEQRDRLEAGVRLALSALAQNEPEQARSLLEEALQRASDAAAHPVSTLGPLPGTE